MVSSDRDHELTEIVSQCRILTPRALEALCNVMLSKASRPADRTAAARTILAYAWGSPPEAQPAPLVQVNTAASVRVAVLQAILQADWSANGDNQGQLQVDTGETSEDTGDDEATAD